MKTPKILVTALALTMGLSNVALAYGGSSGGRGEGSRAERHEHRRDGDGDRSWRDGQRQDRREDRRQEWRQERRQDWRHDRREAHHEWRHDRRAAERRFDERWDRRDPRWNRHWHRGAGPQYNLYRGGHLPPRYRGQVYVVNDWRGHRLHRPPPGYHWVQTGGDYVLAAIATGVILSILLGH